MGQHEEEVAKLTNEDVVIVPAFGAETKLMDLIAHFGARNVTRLPVRLIVSNGRGPPPVNDRDFHGHDDPPPFAA